MSDQAPTEETPDAVETTADEQAQVNWEKRYNDLRPEFDRTSQEAAQYRQLVAGLSSDDPDTRLQAAEALGIEFVDTEDDPDEGLFDDPTVTRLSALEQKIAQREAREAEQAQAAEEQTRVEQAQAIVDAKLTELSIEDQDDKDAVLGLAITMPPTPEGLPDVEAAFARLQARDTARMKQWAGTKKGAHVSPVGTPGTQVPDLDNREARQAWMKERLASLNED